MLSNQKENVCIIKIKINKDKTINYIKNNYKLTSLSENLIREMFDYFETNSSTLTSYQTVINDVRFKYYYNIKYDDLISILEKSGIDITVMKLQDNGCMNEENYG